MRTVSRLEPWRDSEIVRNLRLQRGGALAPTHALQCGYDHYYV